jgi:hypothetical protein
MRARARSFSLFLLFRAKPGAGSSPGSDNTTIVQLSAATADIAGKADRGAKIALRQGKIAGLAQIRSARQVLRALRLDRGHRGAEPVERTYRLAIDGTRSVQSFPRRVKMRAGSDPACDAQH